MQQQNEFAANSNIGDGVIDPNAVVAQTAANTDVEGTAGAQAIAAIEEALTGEGTIGMNANEAAPETTERHRLYKDEEWRREGNNKKFRDPAKEKRRKKIAAASRKRNRRA